MIQTDEESIGLTNSKVYAPEHNLQVYGTGLPEENLILRLFAPDETIAKFDQLTTNADGSFNYSLLTWPQPSQIFLMEHILLK